MTEKEMAMHCQFNGFFSQAGENIQPLTKQNDMKIWNTDKNEMVEITYVLAGCDCLRDLIAGSKIRYNGDEERYEAPSEEIDWWAKWVAKSEEADALEAALAATLGHIFALQVSIEAASGCDFGDAPVARIRAIKEAIAEAAMETNPSQLS